MKNKLLEHQYNFRRDPSIYAEDELVVIVLKPGFTSKHKEEVLDFVNSNKLKLIHDADFQFDPNSTLALYNDIFKFSDKDIMFGYKWKDRKLDYMVSGQSHFYIARGRNAQSLGEVFKYKMRDAYGKLSVPDKKLSNDEFEELAIKNIIHVVDASETEIALRLFT